MKIGFLINHFDNTTGGAQDNCYNLARELAKRGHEVHAFCSGEEEKEEVVEGIQFHKCKTTKQFSYYLHFYPSVVKKLQEYKLDILHVHGIGFPQNEKAIRALKKAQPNVKIVCTPHGPFMCLNNYPWYARIFKKVYMYTLKRTLKLYDKFIQVNNSQWEWLTKDYGVPKEKVVYLPNGINKSTFDKVDNEYLDKIIKKYNLAGHFAISYLGRIQKYKGIDQIISILPELKKIHPNILFVAMGKDTDGYQKELEELANNLGVKDNIRFMGRVSEKDKLALLDLSEIFVFPSEWEAFGIVVIEAMARRNAIISTKTEGGKFLIKEGINGYLFDYQDKAQLLKLLSHLIINNTLRNQMKANNYAKAHGFLWKDIVINLEKIYGQ